MMVKKVKGAFPVLLSGACFGTWFLTFMLIEATVNELGTAVVGSDAVNFIYTFGLIWTGIGFLSFPLLHKIITGKKLQDALMIVIGLLAIIALLMMLETNFIGLFLASAAISLLACGYIGAYIHYDIAMRFARKPYTGKMLGISMGIAIILQYIIQNVTVPSSWALSGIIGMLVVILFGIFLSKAMNTEFKESLPNEERNLKVSRLIIAIVLMSMVAGMIDSVLTAFNAEKVYDIYSGARLFYALGLIVAGIVADLKERKYLALATVCAILLSSSCMFFLSEEVGYFAGTALMYLYSSFYVIFFTLMFIDHAPYSRCPKLWAGMGRIVRSLGLALTVIPAFKIYGAVGSIVLATASCLLSIVILLVLLPNILAAVDDRSPTMRLAEISSQEKLEIFAKHCSLTPRESEVLEKLLTTDEDLQDIADSLYISRRMVQRHVTSIYEKTQTKTRVGLFQSYIKFNG